MSRDRDAMTVSLSSNGPSTPPQLTASFSTLIGSVSSHEHTDIKDHLTTIATPEVQQEVAAIQEAVLRILSQDQRLAESLSALTAERNTLLSRLGNAQDVLQAQEVKIIDVPPQKRRSVQAQEKSSLITLSTGTGRQISAGKSTLTAGRSFADVMLSNLKEAASTSDSLPSVCRKEESQASVTAVGGVYSHLVSSGDNKKQPDESDMPTNTSSMHIARNLIKDFALAQGWIKPVTDHRNGCVEKCVFGGWFDGFCAMIIVVNSVLLAVSTNYSAEHGIADEKDLPVVFGLLDQAFNWWFLFELLLRVKADGLVTFWSCELPHWTWNYFDTVVVVTSFVDTFVQMASDSSAGTNLTTLRMLRVLRVARALRVVRLVRIFKSLRMMVLSIMSSFGTLFWAIVLLVLMMFIFGIFLTQNVTAYLHKNETAELDADVVNNLERFFGTLVDTVYTLFIAVAGGISWNEVSDPLFKTAASNGFLFCFYIFFTMFAMLNIITGIFLDTAMRAAQNDKDECISEHLHAENSTIRLMQAIFDEVDADNSGVISFTEFQSHLDNPQMRAHLASLGIQADEAEGLFRLLDLDGSGTVTVEEFLFGCLRVKGHAKAIDVATLMYENKRMVHKWSVFMRYVEKQFKKRHLFDSRLEAKIDRLRGVEHFPITSSTPSSDKMATVCESPESPAPPTLPVLREGSERFRRI